MAGTSPAIGGISIFDSQRTSALGHPLFSFGKLETLESMTPGKEVGRPPHFFIFLS